ncbi:MAG: hypothetical protein HY402_04145 [Elusimicrobia bacterium]|nr:hypothetical protein [Elusimicrobiota bacterium]
MKYWAYLQGQVVGPHPPEELAKVAGFHQDLLLCPEGATGESEGDWVRAETLPELESVFKSQRLNPASVSLSHLPALADFPTPTGSREIKDLETLEKENSTLRLHLEKVNEELQKAQSALQHLDSLKTDLLKKEQTLEQSWTRIGQLESQLQQSQQKLQKQEVEVASVLNRSKDRIRELEMRLKETAKEDEVSKYKLGQTEGLLKVLQEEKGFLQNRLQELQNKLDSTREDLHKKIGEIDQKNRDLQEAQEAVVQAGEELKKLKPSAPLQETSSAFPQPAPASTESLFMGSPLEDPNAFFGASPSEAATPASAEPTPPMGTPEDLRSQPPAPSAAPSQRSGTFEAPVGPDELRVRRPAIGGAAPPEDTMVEPQLYPEPEAGEPPPETREEMTAERSQEKGPAELPEEPFEALEPQKKPSRKTSKVLIVGFGGVLLVLTALAVITLYQDSRNLARIQKELPKPEPDSLSIAKAIGESGAPPGVAPGPEGTQSPAEGAGTSGTLQIQASRSTLPIPEMEPAEGTEPPSRDAVISFLQNYQLPNDKRRLVALIQSLHVPENSKDFQSDWSVVLIEAQTFAVQYRLGVSKNQRSAQEFIYLFEVDMNKKSVKGLNKKANELLAGAYPAAPKKERAQRVARKKTPQAPPPAPAKEAEFILPGIPKNIPEIAEPPTSQPPPPEEVPEERPSQEADLTYPPDPTEP